MMTSKTPIAFFLVCAVGFGTAAAGAENLTPRELKKLDKQAAKELKAGRADQAAELYRQLLDATEAGDALRQDALWTVAVSRLAAEPGDEAARHYLGELAESFPRHPHQPELAAMTAVLAAVDGARAEAAAAQAKLDAQQAAAEEARLQLEEMQKEIGENEATGDRVKNLEGQLRRVRAELAATKEERDKKEEALQRLLKLRSERGSG
jgi:hypothetical protein